MMFEARNKFEKKKKSELCKIYTNQPAFTKQRKSKKKNIIQNRF